MTGEPGLLLPFQLDFYTHQGLPGTVPTQCRSLILFPMLIKIKLLPVEEEKINVRLLNNFYILLGGKVRLTSDLKFLPIHFLNT
jgi:hypothetical protein